jgi:putative Holliday junction resolvase
LAISDELGMTCAPAGFVSRESAIEKISDLIKAENISKIVVGLPLLESGDEGSQAKDVREFVATLKKKVVNPIVFENEYLSSAVALHRLQAVGESKPEKGSIDAMAACIILESYLGENKFE